MSTLLTCTSSTRPGSPAAGDTLFETDTNKVIVYSGTAWKEYQDNGQLYNDSSITALSPHIWLDGAGGYFYDDNLKSNLVSLTNSRVGAWADRSGNGFDFVQATATSKPKIVNNLGTYNNTFLHYDSDTLVFTGTVASQIAASPSTLFFVGQVFHQSNDSIILSSDTSLRLLTIVSGTDLRIAVDDLGGVGATSYALTDSGINLSRNIFIYAFRVGTSLVESFVNGSASADTETSIPTGTIFNNGANYELFDNTVNESPNFLGEFMVFDSALSDSNMNTVFSYLSKKYGVTVSTL
jgi:hypothetical protein